MIIKSCRTCKHYSGNIELSDTFTETMHIVDSAWCNHELSSGTKTTQEMIFSGPCGRELKLWTRKTNEKNEM